MHNIKTDTAPNAAIRVRTDSLVKITLAKTTLG